MPDLMPHGYCLFWQSKLMIMHILADTGIALAYLLIPIILLSAAVKYKIRIGEDKFVKGLLFSFAMFILACGATHIIDIIVIWEPIYWFQLWVKLYTACISLLTAIYIAPRLICRQRQLEEALNHTLHKARLESTPAMNAHLDELTKIIDGLRIFTNERQARA